MKNLFDILVVLFLICLSLGLVDPTAEAKVDQHTIAVWLFEEGSGDRLKMHLATVITVSLAENLSGSRLNLGTV